MMNNSYNKSGSKLTAMKKIIVPSDFSDVSKDAFRFAMKLAPVLGVSVKVVHVFSGSFNTVHPFVIRAEKGQGEILSDELQAFMEKDAIGGKIALKPKVKVKYEAIVGLPEWEIVKFSQSPETEAIVMGTTGSHGVIGKLFGTISTDVSRKAGCPVFLIPGKVQFTGFKNILFASHFEATNESTLKRLVNIANLFHANVHFVHVKEEDEKYDYKVVENRIFEILFREETPSFAFNMTVTDGHSVVDGLNNYVLNKDIDLVVMVAQQRSFWKDILHKSKTKNMALNTKLPLLILHVGIE